MDDKEMAKIVREKNLLYAIQPHGVMSICGLAYGMYSFTSDYY